MLPLCAVAQPTGDNNSNVKEVIVICKTHFDIGYTHRVKDVVNYYQTRMIDQAFAAMDESKTLPAQQQFQWTIPGWVLSKTMENWPGQSDLRRDRLDGAFRSGQIITHAMPFTLESDACELEPMVRGMIHASRLTRQYNLPLPRSAKQTDVPSHAGALASVLANGDVKFLHIGCNWPSGFVKTPGLFWWEAPDKSRVLTLYSSMYGTTYGLLVDSWGDMVDRSTDKFIGVDFLPPKDWPYKIWPVILVTGDNEGPPTAAQIKAMFEGLTAKMPDVKVRMGTMDDFYKAIESEDPDIPVVKGEMPDTWVHGVMSDPNGMRLSRWATPTLASAEVLHTQLQGWGAKSSPIADTVATAYEKILLYGEHTFGGAGSVVEYGKAFEQLPPEKYAALEASWEDKTDYIRDAAALTHQISSANMLALARMVKHSDSCVVVYNPLPWSRSATVEVDQRRIFAANVPPCGYATYPLKRQSGKKLSTAAASETLENEWFKIDFDPRSGSIASLVDKRTQRQWVDKKADRGLGQYLNERFTYEQAMDYTMTYQQNRAREWAHPGIHKPGMISEREVPYRAAVAAGGQLRITRHGNSQIAEMTMPADPASHMPASLLRVTICDDAPYIDMEIEIRDKAKDNWPEADWLCLPFNITDPEFRVHRPLGVMNPATDIVPGANRHIYSVGNGVTITGSDGAGIAVCPLDHPLISLDTPGCWKFSYDFVPQKPVIYLNLYNNQWNTNFRYWYPGTWSSRVRVWTIDKGTDADSFLATQALEARNPLQAVMAEGETGTLPSRHTGLQLSRKGVSITAFGADPDGNEGTLLRVWEQAGTSGTLTVTLPKGVTASQATPVNLRGEVKGDPVAVKSGKFEVDLAAYAPASFIIK